MDSHCHQSQDSLFSQLSSLLAELVGKSFSHALCIQVRFSPIPFPQSHPQLHSIKLDISPRIKNQEA